MKVKGEKGNNFSQKESASKIIQKIIDYKLGKNNNVYYKVSEISKLTGFSRQQIHLYTQLGLIKEAFRTPSGYRYYSPQVIDRLFLIEMLKRHRTLEEVKKLLQEKYEN